MSGVIKSLTTKIGADTSDFIKELKKVDRELKSTSKEANELQKGLELKFDAGRFVQAQRQVQIALSNTEDKAEAIRKQLKFLEDSGSVDTAGYQKLQLELAKTENNAEKLKQQLEKLDEIKFKNLTKGFDDFGNKMENAGAKLRGVSLAASGALAGIGVLAKGAAASGASFDDMAQRTQIATEKLEELRYVALQTGVEEDQLQKALIKTRAAWADLESGNINNQTKALEQLGITAGEFQTSEDAFDGVINALSNISDKTQQAALANEIFGDKLANNLIPYLNAGSDEIQRLKDEFAEMPSLSADQVAALAGLDDEFNRLNQTWEYSKMQLGLALLPLIEEFTGMITDDVLPVVQDFADWFGSLDESMQKAMIGGLGFIAILSPLLIMVGKVSYGIGALVKMFTTLNATTIKTTAGFMALAGALTMGLDLIHNWGQMSAVEKVLKSLAVAALTAAAAMAVFHASASVGLAVGAIAAGVTAARGAIEAAKKKLLPDEPALDVSTEGIERSMNNNDNYNLPSRDNAGSYIEDNSKIEVNIEMNPTGDLNYDAKDLANEVIKQIVIQKQALGR